MYYCLCDIPFKYQYWTFIFWMISIFVYDYYEGNAMHARVDKYYLQVSVNYRHIFILINDITNSIE